MTSTTTTAPFTKPISAPTLVGTADTSRDSRSDLPSQLQQQQQQQQRRYSGANSTAWKRGSISLGDAYFQADVAVRASGKIDDVLVRRSKSGDRERERDGSTMSQYKDASKHRSSHTQIQPHIPAQTATPTPTLYHEDQFRYKDADVGTVRDRVQRESPVLAELKTNVIIKDEFTLVTDLSYHLAQRYTRPDSSIMIKVDHSACLALGGTFDPCYILNVTTVPSSMGPSLNKRNAALIQSFMADILSVPSDRGIVKFTPIEEANYATNGTTMLGEMERLEKHQQENGGMGNAVRRAVTNASRKSASSFNNKVASPRPDTDVKTPTSVGAAHTVSAVDQEHKDKQKSKRRSTTTDPAVASAIPNVFELAATESNTDRPSTAHGVYAAENGLRMNGISKENLTGAAARTPNGRPKTFAGSSASPEESAQEPMPQSHSSHGQRTSSSNYRKSIGAEPVRKTTPHTTTSSNIPTSPRPQERTSRVPDSHTALKSARASKPPPAADTQSMRSTPAPSIRTTNTYLDNLPTEAERRQNSTSAASILTLTAADPKFDAKAAEKNRLAQVKTESTNGSKDAGKDGKDVKDTAANTAKRRSTVTATPRLPVPPPVPQEKEKGGSAGQKVGKRKSFLSAFRRSAAA